jgi:hypothetical protein
MTELVGALSEGRLNRAGLVEPTCLEQRLAKVGLNQVHGRFAASAVGDRVE